MSYVEVRTYGEEWRAIEWSKDLFGLAVLERIKPIK